MNNSDYQQRMNDYYPEVIQRIKEFQAIIHGESAEFSELGTSNEQVLADAYLTTMSETRVKQWEKILNIPLEVESSLADRRDNVIAKMRGQGKLNSALINLIVNTFTGGTANSYVRDGVLYVEITPSRDNRSDRFANVEQELKNKVPAHLGLSVSRNYFTWNEIITGDITWQNVSDNFDTWYDLYITIPVTGGGNT